MDEASNPGQRSIAQLMGILIYCPANWPARSQYRGLKKLNRPSGFKVSGSLSLDVGRICAIAPIEVYDREPIAKSQPAWPWLCIAGLDHALLNAPGERLRQAPHSSGLSRTKRVHDLITFLQLG